MERFSKKQKEIIIAMGVVCLAIGAAVPVVYHNFFFSTTTSKIDKVRSILENDWYYADDVEDLDSLLTEQAVSGMTSLEQDAHTNYFGLEDAKKFSSELQGTNVGIGVQFYKQSDGNVYVKYVYINSAADEAGIQSGDVITKIGNKNVSDMSKEDIVTYIQDREGKSIDFEVTRNEESLSFQLTPSEYDSTVICNVYDGYGEIILTSFSSHSGADFAIAMARLKDAGVTKMILDLRDNTGGLLSAAITVASSLLPNDTIVFYNQDKDGNLTEEKTDDSYSQIEMDKIVVLQNGSSASASEVLIGALQDVLGDKVTLVGETTYGKATEQSIVNFDDGTSLKYTFAQWLTPSKKSINKKGFEPDIKVEDTSIGSVSYKTMEEDSVIEANTVNDNAAALQTFLRYLGYEVDREDTYYSKTSSNVLKKFQQDNNLAPTGNCDYKTWQKITELALNKYNQNYLDDDAQRNKAIELLA